MRLAIAAALLAATLPFSAMAGEAKPASANQLAWFQTQNIFHSGLRGTHIVALTFDDGPNFNTGAVLDALKANNVKATFFIVGRMAHAYPDMLKRIVMEGHLLGNHSATHPLLGRRYVRHPDMLLAQLRDVDDQITPLMPVGAKFYFRAPYGSWRAPHADALNADPILKKYVGPIYWDEGGSIEFDGDGYILASADWDCWHRKWDADTCAKGYLREIRRKDGGVVLMHCIGSKAGELVADVVPALAEEGYSFLRLDQLPAYRQYETPPTETAPVVVATGGGRVTGAAR